MSSSRSRGRRVKQTWRAAGETLLHRLSPCFPQFFTRSLFCCSPGCSSALTESQAQVTFLLRASERGPATPIKLFLSSCYDPLWWDKCSTSQFLSYYLHALFVHLFGCVLRWADTYNLGMFEELVSDPPKCAMCGQPATKRCSRCQTEWYCKR